MKNRHLVGIFFGHCFPAIFTLQILLTTEGHCCAGWFVVWQEDVIFSQEWWAGLFVASLCLKYPESINAMDMFGYLGIDRWYHMDY